MSLNGILLMLCILLVSGCHCIYMSYFYNLNVQLALQIDFL